MIKLGITGSINSGKTLVTNIIKKRGIPTFCADRTVENIYLKDQRFKKKIYKLQPILKKKKSLKKEIKKIIFRNKTFLKTIEKIIHPIVRKKMNQFINLNKNKKIIALDIPLLIESKIYQQVDKILLVKCSKKIRKRRFLLKKKNIKLFDLMEKKQLNFLYKKRFADYIIDNGRSITNTRREVIKVIKKIKKNA